MNDAKRVYGLGIGLVESPSSSGRPCLEGTISALTDKIEYACKECEELHSGLGSVLYPQPPTEAVESLKQTTSVVPPAIERLEALSRKMDRLNAVLGSIQSRLCL